MHTFEEGPSLHIQIDATEEGFSSKLSFAPSFRVSFSANTPSILKEKILKWLESYGKKSPTPIDFLPRQKLPPFTKAVLEALFKVPFGKVISYSELANLAGSGNACRAVGTICRKNPFPLFIPCHRVVKNGGEQGNFAFGSLLKTVLLEFEQPTQK